MLSDRHRFTFVVCGLLALGAGGASAQTAPAAAPPTTLGAFKDWTAYAAPVKGGRVCYALATPGKGKRNAAQPPAGAYFFISNRPHENVLNEASVTPGFPLKADSTVEIEVDDATFKMAARGDGAFMNSNEEQAALVLAMREARKAMTVKLTPAKGRASTQTYSLAGIAAALDKINAECKGPAPKR